MSKGPKGQRKPRGPKTKSNVPGAEGVAGAGHNRKKPELTPDQERELFLNHRKTWNVAQAKVAAAKKGLDDVKDALKNDGFTVKQFQLADQLADQAGEAKVVAEVKDRLKVARWMGHPMGAQLDLFADAQPAGDKASADSAYDRGKMASMENRQPKPQDENYAPDSEQWRAYMAGYHDHQRELAGGLKAPDEATQSTLASQAAGASPH